MGRPASPISEEGKTLYSPEDVIVSQFILKDGYLRKKSQNLSRDWNRRFFQLTSTTLLYYHHEESRKIRGAIPLISVSVKGPLSVQGASSAGEGERLGGSSSGSQARRFRLITPARDYMLEAETAEEAHEWTLAIMGANQEAILAGSNGPGGQSSSPVGLQSGSGDLARLIRGVPEAGNDRCVDCGVGGIDGVPPTWISVNLGIVLCIDCSGVHRSLGCQVSKVRSLELDSFLPETLSVVRMLGNTRMNAVWEALDAPPPGSALRANRSVFIQQKYIERRWTGETLTRQSPAESPTDSGSSDGALRSDPDSGIGPGTPDSLKKRPTHQPTLSPLGQPKGPACLYSPELAFFESVRTSNVLNTATLLFRHAIDVNLTDGISGMTALHMAAAAGQLLQVHFLVLNGADLSGRERGGRTPETVAADAGHAEVVDHLAKVAGANGLGRAISAEAKQHSLMETRIRKALMGADSFGSVQ